MNGQTVDPFLNDSCTISGKFNPGATYRVIAIVTGSLSLVGTLFIILSFCLFRKLRSSFGFRMVLCLACANFISAVQVIFQSANEHCYNAACTAGAYMSQFGNLAGVLCVAYIGCYYFIGIRRSTHSTAFSRRFDNRKEVVLHTLMWGLPGLFTIIAGAVGMFGVTGMWCWISSDFLIARVCMYDVWIFATYAWSIFLLIWVCTHQNTVDPRVRPVARRLIYYVLVFFLCNIFTVVGTFSFYLQREEKEWISIAIALFEPLHGFANAIVYGLNRNVRELHGDVVSLMSSY